MEHTPARVLRRRCIELGFVTFSEKDDERAYEIMCASIRVFAKRGLYGVPLTRFAHEIGSTAQRIRHLFCDLEHLLGEVLRTYVGELIAELNAIPATAVNRPALCRAAYARMLRDFDGNLHPLHDLLVRLAPQLPRDELELLETRLKELHAMLGAGIVGTTAASLLDRTSIPLERLEIMLVVLMQGQQPAPRLPSAANQNAPAPNCRPVTRPPGSSVH